MNRKKFILKNKENILKQKENAISEKKKWISLTGLCNNNCIFCLDGDRTDKFHKSEKEIKKEIDEGLESGATRLVLSGGEPTIHPSIIEFIRYGKQKGYKKIQIITNGRMLAYMSFVKSLKDAGLDEVTFSLHGHTKKIHEAMTRIPGSFAQIISGMRNAREVGFIINTDTTITKINYQYLLEITSFIHKLGINEVNLMSVVPFGNTWKNKKEVLYEFEDIIPYVRRAIEFCRNNNMILWFSRFPAAYLEGYEEYIESYKKIVEEVLAREEKFFSNEMPCKGEKCKWCGINMVCEELIRGINNYEYHQSKKPTCISGLRDEKPTIDKCSSFEEYAENICKNSTLKRLICKECVLNASCVGAQRELIRKRGFQILNPIKMENLRHVEVNPGKLK